MSALWATPLQRATAHGIPRRRIPHRPQSGPRWTLHSSRTQPRRSQSTRHPRARSRRALRTSGATGQHERRCPLLLRELRWRRPGRHHRNRRRHAAGDFCP